MIICSDTCFNVEDAVEVKSAKFIDPYTVHFLQNKSDGRLIATTWPPRRSSREGLHLRITPHAVLNLLALSQRSDMVAGMKDTWEVISWIPLRWNRVPNRRAALLVLLASLLLLYQEPMTTLPPAMVESIAICRSRQLDTHIEALLSMLHLRSAHYWLLLGRTASRCWASHQPHRTLSALCSASWTPPLRPSTGQPDPVPPLRCAPLA